MDAALMEREILASVQPPRIGAARADIRDFGAAEGLGAGVQTAALQRAVDEVSRAGGGRVAVPAGCWLTGALRLKSGVELHLEEGARLCFSTDPADYPLEYVHWEGTPCINYSSLVYAYGEHDIALTGPGVLDGQAGATAWWNWHHQTENAWSEGGANPQEPARMRMRAMNEAGVPPRERVFGDGCWLRPNFIQFIRCERVALEGVTVTNSPMWNINPVLCTDVTVRGVTVRSHGPNSDGCDPESCTRVLIERCRFDTGDDCISLKSGRDRDGRETNVPCSEVLIRENEFADGHGGIALGSEMSGGIRRVAARANRFDSPNLTYALRLKSNAVRGGTVEQIALTDSDIRSVGGAAIHGTMLYEDGRRGGYLPVFRDILIENVRAHGGDYGIFLEAFPEVPITGLELRNICIDGAAHGLHAANWKDAVLENVVINGEEYPRPVCVHILGVPCPGEEVRAAMRSCTPLPRVAWRWELERDGRREAAGEGERFTLPQGSGGANLILTADADGRCGTSRAYRVLGEPLAGVRGSHEARRLETRGIPVPDEEENAPVTRRMLAPMVLALLGDTAAPGAEVRRAQELGVLGAGEEDGAVTRQEMATVAMQCCGVSYRNASTTTPDCADADEVDAVWATNAARALYFGFLTLDKEGRFRPSRAVTVREAVQVLCRTADFAGI